MESGEYSIEGAKEQNNLASKILVGLISNPTFTDKNNLNSEAKRAFIVEQAHRLAEIFIINKIKEI